MHAGTDFDRRIEITARHVARLGPSLHRALVRTVGAEASGAWAFLDGGPGHRCYNEAVRRLERAYQALGRQPATERELRGEASMVRLPGQHVDTVQSQWCVVRPVARRDSPTDPLTDALQKLGDNATGRVWLGGLPDPTRTQVAMAEVIGRVNPSIEVSSAWSEAEGPLPPGTELRLPVEDIYFSQDSCSEQFSGQTRRSILETVLLLWGGSVRVEDVPVCSVFWFQGRWHVRTGNRRLIAWRLLRIFAPARFSTVFVCVACPPTEFFVSRRMSTLRNDEQRQGEWTLVRETGEFVSLWEASFGSDILELVCGPPAARVLSEAGGEASAVKNSTGSVAL